MQKICTFVVLVIVYTTNLLAAKNIEVLSKVENVVVYHSGALVSRVADNKIGVGLFELEFKDISQTIRSAVPSE